MISLFYPISKSPCKRLCQIPYMPPLTASYMDASAAGLGVPNGTVESIRLQVCCSTPRKPAVDVAKFPLVLFSPGLQGSRLLYSALAQSLASEGYAVVTMDHTFETGLVEFPDGSAIRGLPDSYFDGTIPGRLESVFDVRIADARFVLRQLSRKDVVNTLVPGASSSFSEHGTKKALKLGFYGHSFGGALAIAMLLSPSSPLSSAINLDGSQFGNLSDTRNPALFFGRAEPSPHNRTLDPTWAEAWSHLKGCSREVAARDIEHNTFGDTALLLQMAVDAGLMSSDDITGIIGALNGKRAFEIVTGVVRAFFDMTLKGIETGVLDPGSLAYPELVLGGKGCRGMECE
jgi:dienelactone hydrolase